MREMKYKMYKGDSAETSLTVCGNYVKERDLFNIDLGVCAWRTTRMAVPLGVQ